MRHLHDLAEDIVFFLIWKKFLDIDHRKEAIRKVYHLLIVLSGLLAAGVLAILILCILRGSQGKTTIGLLTNT